MNENFEANYETTLIGLIMMDKGASQIMAEVDETEFSSPVARRVYSAMKKEWSRSGDTKGLGIIALSMQAEEKEYAFLCADTLVTTEWQVAVEKLKERNIIEQAKSVAPGNNYKEIRCKGVDGEEIALSDVIAKNRYVLLDFWASSCVPCMHELPHLLAAYEKYHSKGFEIYALSLDNDKNAWRNTTKEKDMSWVNVLRESTEVSEQYGVRGVPSNFLIDCSTGKIIAVHLRGETLIAKLMELFE